MIKRAFSFLLIAVVISSCGSPVKKDASSKTEGSENATKVEFASLVENPDNYVNKNIIIEGKVVHVCTHSGKKMFIVGEDPDIRLFIAAGENMPKFPMELLGSEIIVEGMITKMAKHETAAIEPQSKIIKTAQPTKGAPEKPAGDNCETEAAVEAQAALTNIVMEYKCHTVK